MPLNAQQLRFVALYQKSLAAGKPNATQAYIDAGYKARGRSAENAASRLLGTVGVQQLLKPATEAAEVAKVEQVREIVINRERIRIELARLAFVNPKRLFNSDGTTKPIHELDDDTAAAIAGIEVEEEHTTGADSKTRIVTRTKKFKLWDKTRALRTLGDTEPGVWVNEKEGPSGHTTNVNVAVMSDDELRRRIDALEGGAKPAVGPQRLFEVAADPPAGVQLVVAASGEGNPPEAPEGYGPPD